MAGLQNQPLDKKLIAVGGFIMLGASPSYVDWQDHPEKRKQIIGFYVVAIGMFWYGLLS